MKYTALILLAAACANSQTIYLRYGGPRTNYRIQAITTGATATVTVVPAWEKNGPARSHSLANGDVVYVQGVMGCAEANGAKKVRSVNQGAGTFILTTLADVDVTCAEAFDFTYQTGWVGKARATTMLAFPRGFIGQIDARSKDPDGSGPLVAGVVTENGHAWQQMLAATNARITPGCDPLETDTGAGDYCTVAESMTTSGAGYMHQAAHAAAYVYTADNSKTDHLNLARWILANYQRFMWANGDGEETPPFACPDGSKQCSMGSGADWPSEAMQYLGFAYGLIRNQMTSGERASFAKRMMWGFEDGCDNRAVQQTGTMTLPAAASGVGVVKAVTGTGFSAYSNGDTIYYQGATFGSNSYQWATVTNATSDTAMTITTITTGTNVASGGSGFAHYKIGAHTDNSCGMWTGTAGHDYWSWVGDEPVMGKLSGSHTSSTTTLNLQSTANMGDFTAPFWARIQGSEWVRVTAFDRVAKTMTVARGQLFSTAAARSNGNYIRLMWQPRVEINSIGTDPDVILGPWSHNLSHIKIVGYVVSACSLAGDYPKATEKCEKAWNLYHDVTWPTINDSMAPSQGGWQEVGYQFGRWPTFFANVALIGKYTFSPSIDEMLQEKQLWNTVDAAMRWTKNQNFRSMPSAPDGPTGDSTYSIGSGPMYACMGAKFNTDATQAAHHNYWMRNLWNYSSNAGGSPWRRYAWMAAHCPDNDPQIDPRIDLDPWTFYLRDSSSVRPDYSTGTVISRSGWEANASMFISLVAPATISDHATYSDTYGSGGVPGLYQFSKGSKSLINSNSAHGQGVASSSTNFFEISTAANHTASFGSGAFFRPTGEPFWFTRANGGGVGAKYHRTPYGSDEWVYAAGNYSDSYVSTVGVLRSMRHFLHIKGTIEYLIVFDDHLTSLATTRRTRLNWHRANDTASAFTELSATEFRLRKPTLVSGMSGSINTKVLFPDGQAPTLTDPGTTTYLNRRQFDWGNTGTSAQMIAIHRMANNTTDVMPAVRAITSDSNFRGFEIDDGSSSKIVMFSKDGSDYSAMTAVATYSGAGRAYITGLNPSSVFTLNKDGVPVEDISSSSGGTLAFNATGPGTFSLAPSGAVLMSLSEPSLSFAATTGGSDPATQTVTVTCTQGGDCGTIGATKVGSDCAWLTVTPGSTLHFAAALSGVAEGDHLCDVDVSSTTAANSPQRIPVNFSVSPVSTTGVFASVPGLTWEHTIAGLSPTGKDVEFTRTPSDSSVNVSVDNPIFELNGSGGSTPLTITVTPNATGLFPGEHTGVLTATDGTSSVQVDLALTVLPPAGAQLLPSPTVAGNQTVVEYGFVGLRRDQACSIRALRRNESNDLVETERSTDTGGLARRANILVGLDPGEYTFESICGSSYARSNPIQVAAVGTPVTTSVTLGRRPPTGLGITNIVVAVGTSPGSLTDGSPVACTSGCQITLSGLTSGQVYYIRHKWRNASNVVLATSDVTRLIVP